MPHHDASTFTINIALNRVGEDYEVSQGLGAQRQAEGGTRRAKSPGDERKMVQVCGEGFLEEWDQGTAQQGRNTSSRGSGGGSAPSLLPHLSLCPVTGFLTFLFPSVFI